MDRKRILFLCTGNCCRSQMAEGLLRHFHGQQYEALSAGVSPAGYVHPQAVAAMAELNIDISAQTSKSILEFVPPDGDPPDVIISVCARAVQNCPVFPSNVERWQWPFPDPFYATGTSADKQHAFRDVRDQMLKRLQTTFARHASMESRP